MSARHVMNTNKECCVHALDHIKKLPEAERAAQMLKELKRHVDPVLAANGWKVNKLYEICCCTAGGKNLSVGGFCCPAGDGQTSLRIALRLRTPRSHELCDFDHAMRILIHEITHITVGSHSVAFYELMDKLSRQYDTLRTKGQVLDEQGMPLIGGRTIDSSRHNPSMPDARRAALQAAQNRANTSAIMGGGGRLGGASNRLAGGEWQSRSAAEMAASAALGRQRRWDEEHGLDSAELEAAAEQDGPSNPSSRPPSRTASRPPSNPPSKPPSRPASPPCQPSGGDGGGGSGGSGSSGGGGVAPQSISWAQRGHGAWQNFARPLVPPSQDVDEGAAGEEIGMVTSAAAPMPGDRRAVSPSRAVSQTPRQIVDLTGSDDEPEPLAAAAIPKRERKRTRPNGAGAAAQGGPAMCAAAAKGWQCPRCTFANGAGSVVCAMDCGYSRDPAGGQASCHPPASLTPLPLPSLPSSTWACAACTLANSKALSHCGACGNWRYSRPL